MEYSILKSTIPQKQLETYVTKRVYDSQYWPLFFPFKQKSRLTVETLIGEEGNRVAADIVSYDSSAPEKRRPVTNKLTTELPAIRVKRKMSEIDLNEYFSLLALADSEGQREALKIVFGDIDFVMNAVLGRLEWMALQTLAKGIISLTATNNTGIVTEANIDFQLPTGNKEYIGSAGGTAAATHYWTTAVKATNDPITDIESIISEAATSGVKLNYMLMNRTKWNDFRQSAAVQDFVAPYMVYGGTRKKLAPSLEIMNDALKGYGFPEAVVIDTRVSIENADHTITSVDPWLHTNDAYVTFLENLQVGNMLWCKTAEEQAPPKQALHMKKGPILISKYSDVDPVAEYTAGLLNAFPSWPTIDRAWILNTESHTAF